jgi:hypothetical protein
MKRTTSPATNSPAMIPALRPASFGSVSSGTLRSEDLLNALHSELEWQVQRNGAFLACPENFPLRDRCAKLLGEASDAFGEDGETLTEEGEEHASEIISDLCDCLSEFAPSYGYFGAHEGDGACFGYWVNVENVKEQVAFVSSKRQPEPAADFRGEWLEVNERGNCTLFVREDNTTDAFARDGYVDREVWGIV